MESASITSQYPARAITPAPITVPVPTTASTSQTTTTIAPQDRASRHATNNANTYASQTANTFASGNALHARLPLAALPLGHIQEPPAIPIAPAQNATVVTSVTSTTTTTSTLAPSSALTARSRRDTQPSFVQRLSRLFHSEPASQSKHKSEKHQEKFSNGGHEYVSRQEHANIDDKPFDGIRIKSSGKAVIVDKKAYMRSAWQALPAALDAAYEVARVRLEATSGAELDRVEFTAICRIISKLGQDKKLAPRVKLQAILPVSLVYFHADLQGISIDKVNAAIHGLFKEELVEHTFSLNRPAFCIDNGRAIALHPVIYKEQ